VGCWGVQGSGCRGDERCCEAAEAGAYASRWLLRCCRAGGSQGGSRPSCLTVATARR
jgi:hypothetical protein